MIFKNLVIGEVYSFLVVSELIVRMKAIDNLFFLLKCIIAAIVAGLSCGGVDSMHLLGDRADGW